jgi:hypothetical protein
MEIRGVTIHRDGFGPWHPAVNVKVHNVPLTAEDVMREFGADEETAGRAVNFALDAATRAFWMYWGRTDALTSYFPDTGARAVQEGRMGGWLAVEGLPDIEEWTDADMAAWDKFETEVEEDVKARIDKAALMDDIRGNEWWRPFSSEYNFIETAKGNFCIATIRGELNDIVREKWGTSLRKVCPWRED